MQYAVVIPDQLGGFIQSRRKLLKLTQVEAAGKCGLLPKTWSLLENHPERCSVASLNKAMLALGLYIILAPREELAERGRRSAW